MYVPFPCLELSVFLSLCVFPCHHKSQTRQITDSLRHFGLSSTTTSILIVALGCPGSEPSPEHEEELYQKIREVVGFEARVGGIDSLGKLEGGEGTDRKGLRKVRNFFFFGSGVVVRES